MWQKSHYLDYKKIKRSLEHNFKHLRTGSPEDYWVLLPNMKDHGTANLVYKMNDRFYSFVFTSLPMILSTPKEIMELQCNIIPPTQEKCNSGYEPRQVHS